MADGRARSGGASASARRARVEPIRGNARRRTIAILMATAVTVVGVHFALGKGSKGAGGSGAANVAAGDASGGGQSSGQAAASDKFPTYYVSAEGDDKADGTSPDKPWRTLAHADEHKFVPGDHLLLRGGDTFSGALKLYTGEAGQADKPVVIGSYGTGRATIQGGQDPALYIYDTAGVSISGLTIVGEGALKSPLPGIRVYNDLPGDKTLDGVTISQVDVSGFQMGISVVGNNGSSGFSHIKISDSKLHDNRDAGLFSDGPEPDPQPKGQHPLKDFEVSGVEAYDNLGNPGDHKTSTGNGINLGGVDGVRIENSVAHGNGASCASSSGPIGIWIHDVSDAVISHNVSYANRTAAFTDGGGFDVDQNTEDAVMEYNLAHDNWGPGFMVYAGSAAVRSKNVTVRYNLSMDDAQGPKTAESITYGAMMMAGYVDDLSVHHNTIRQTTKSQKATLLNLGGHLLIGLQLRNATVRDNIFAAGAGTMLDAGETPHLDQVVMQGNDYYSATNHWVMKWGGTVYKSLAAWRKATGQEKLKGAPTGSDADPRLVPAGTVPWDPTGARILAPAAGGPAATGALDLSALFGVDPGTEDLLGRPVAGATTLGAVVRTAEG